MHLLTNNNKEWLSFAALVLLAACLASGARAEPTKDVAALRAALAEVMQQEQSEGFSGVVLVAQGGQTLLYEAYGLADRKTRTPMRRDTVIDAGSFSKQVTSAAAVLLESQGKLSLSDPLGKYFDDVPQDKRSITLEQLLSHNSGLSGWVFPHDFVPIPAAAWLDKVFRKPLDHPPGTGYLYSNDGFTLVAMVIERVTGKPYRDYIKETFFRPLGMTRSGWYDDAIFKDPTVSVATGYRNGKDDGDPSEWPGPYWALLGNGGILWTVDDMLKWHRAIHGNLLPAEAKTKLFSPRVETHTGAVPNAGERADNRYALGWNVAHTLCGDVRIGHRGAGLTHNVDYRYYPQRDLVLYVASNKLDENYRGEELFYSQRAANALARRILEGCHS
jgi:CubicO group peptidase (beta-lactamase class C family)